MIPVFSASWQGHTAESRAFADDVTAALTDCGLSQKAAAIAMGLTDVALSKQLAGLHPLNAYRLMYLSVAFQVALLKRRAGRLGAVMLTQSEREFVLACARLGRRRMSKVLPSIHERKAS